jgi:hypothetical protein
VQIGNAYAHKRAQSQDPEPLSIQHFDLYRLRGPADTRALRLEAAFQHAATLVEWPQRLFARADAAGAGAARVAEGADGGYRPDVPSDRLDVYVISAGEAPVAEAAVEGGIIEIQVRFAGTLDTPVGGGGGSGDANSDAFYDYDGDGELLDDGSSSTPRRPVVVVEEDRLPRAVHLLARGPLHAAILRGLVDDGIANGILV